MCQWFSCISDGRGNIFYFNAQYRKQIENKNLFDKKGTVIDTADSHSSISAYYGLDDDKVNKYEYLPINRKFIVNQINANYDDRVRVLRKICKINYKKLAPPELIFKKIVHPFNDKKTLKITKKDLELLKKWDSVKKGFNMDCSTENSVRDSVGASVWDSVGASVRGSVGASVWDSVGASVWNSVGNSVWNSVRDSMWDSVGNSVWDSVRDSVWDYISSFFNLKKWEYINYKEREAPFQSAIDLWERGIVPAHDGTYWYLFGYKGKLLKKVKL